MRAPPEPSTSADGRKTLRTRAVESTTSTSRPARMLDGVGHALARDVVGGDADVLRKLVGIEDQAQGALLRVRFRARGQPVVGLLGRRPWAIWRSSATAVDIDGESTGRRLDRPACGDATLGDAQPVSEGHQDAGLRRAGSISGVATPRTRDAARCRLASTSPRRVPARRAAGSTRRQGSLRATSPREQVPGPDQPRSGRSRCPPRGGSGRVPGWRPRHVQVSRTRPPVARAAAGSPVASQHGLGSPGSLGRHGRRPAPGRPRRPCAPRVQPYSQEAQQHGSRGREQNDDDDGRQHRRCGGVHSHGQGDRRTTRWRGRPRRTPARDRRPPPPPRGRRRRGHGAASPPRWRPGSAMFIAISPPGRRWVSR